MSIQQRRVASQILKEHFGEVVEKVGTYLVAKGPRPLRDVIRETGLSREQVQKALCCLIQHHLVSFEVNKKKITLYNAWISNILLRPRASRYIYCAKQLFGYTAELIVDELLQHGRARMSKVVSKISERLAEDGLDSDENEVKTTFVELVKNHFLQRVGIVETANGDRTEANTVSEDDRYMLPPGTVVQGV